MRHTKHYYRVLLLIVGGVIAFLIVRGVLIPDSFGKFGYYRGDDIREQVAKPIAFANRGSCDGCHSVNAGLHAGGKHKTVQCQNCHAPLSVHIQNGEFLELMPIDRSPALCLRCHRFLPSRPSGFPQINIQEHTGLGEQGLTEGFCAGCHKAHNPTLGAIDG